MKIEYFFAFFALIGIIDKITGNHFKLGDEFEKGISSFGSLIIAMSGTMVLAPVIAQLMKDMFYPLFNYLHLDLSIISIFFSVDSGGAALAYELSDNTLIRGYNGIIVASMFGAAISLIPLSLHIVKQEYRVDILNGLLCGIATIPIGCIIGGLIIGCPICSLLINTSPVIILSVIICIGLIYNPKLSLKIFGIIGNTLIILLFVGLGIGIIHQVTGIKLIPNISPLRDSIMTIGNIAIILSGVFPLLKIISILCSELFLKIGNKLKINNTSILGIVTTLANSIPMLQMTDKMDKKGRIMNMAFAVSAAFTIGDHLAFTLSFDKSFLPAMIIGKLISGISALILANCYCKYWKNKEQ